MHDAVVQQDLELATTAGPGFVCLPNVVVLVGGGIIIEAALTGGDGRFYVIWYLAGAAGDGVAPGVAGGEGITFNPLLLCAATIRGNISHPRYRTPFKMMKN